VHSFLDGIQEPRESAAEPRFERNPGAADRGRPRRLLPRLRQQGDAPLLASQAAAARLLVPAALAEIVNGEAVENIHSRLAARFHRDESRRLFVDRSLSLLRLNFNKKIVKIEEYHELIFPS
jgi:hypothetical protein